MIDIEKAVTAAMNETKDRTARTNFVRFLMRTARRDTPITQYRTIGSATRMTEAFLGECGFGPADYEAYVSRLDPRVVDFRWSDAGKIGEVSSALQLIEQPSSDAGTLSPLGRLLLDIQLGVPYSGFETGRVRADSGSPAARTAFPIHLGETSKRVGDDLVALCRSIVGGTPAPEWIEVTETREFRNTYNGVPSATVDAIASVENPGVFDEVMELWMLEAAVRLLPASALPKAVDRSGFPAHAVFGPGCTSPSRAETLMRYLRPDESVPGFDQLLSGIPAQDHQAYAANDGSENPLATYMSNSAGHLAKVDLADKCAALVVGFCRLNPHDRARSLAFASTRREFWEYLETLYRAVYGLDVGVCPASRVGFTSQTPAWKAAYDMWGLEAESDWGLGNCAVAVYALAMSPNGTSPAWDPTQYAPSERPVQILDEADEPSSDPYDVRFTGWRDFGRLWFSLVHTGGLDWGQITEFRWQRDQTDEARQLAKFRARYLSILPRTVAGLTTYGKSKYLAPNYDRWGSAEYTTPSTFVSGVAAIIKQHATAPITTPRKHPDEDSHPASALVSNVYTCCMEDIPSLGDANGFTKWRDELGASQLAGPAAKPDYTSLFAIVETNVPYEAVSCDAEFIRDMKQLAWNVLGKGSYNPNQFGEHASYAINSDQFRDVFAGTGVPYSVLSHEGEVSNDWQDDRLSVRLAEDAYGRANVVVRLAHQAADFALSYFRYKVGLPGPDSMMACRAHGSRNVPQVTAEGWNADALFNSVVASILGRGLGCPTDWSDFDRWPAYGFGPVITQLHVSGAAPRNRQSFLGGVRVGVSDMVAS